MNNNNDEQGITLLSGEAIQGLYHISGGIHFQRLFWAGLGSLILIGLPFLFSEIVKYKKTKIVITNKRLMFYQGAISFTKNKTVDLSKLDSSEYAQNLIGKLLNAGEISISSIDGEQMVFKDIENPINLIETLNAAREAYKKAGN